jgi:hypothetical protein
VGGGWVVVTARGRGTSSDAGRTGNHYGGRKYCYTSDTPAALQTAPDRRHPKAAAAALSLVARRGGERNLFANYSAHNGKGREDRCKRCGCQRHWCLSQIVQHAGPVRTFEARLETKETREELLRTRPLKPVLPEDPHQLQEQPHLSFGAQSRSPRPGATTAPRSTDASPFGGGWLGKDPHGRPSAWGNTREREIRPPS